MSINNTIVNGFHHIAIRVKDFDASVKFYTEVLGLEEWIRWGEGDGRAVMLHAGQGNYIELFAGGADELKPEGAWMHLAMNSDDPDAAFARAVESGATVHMEPKTIPIPSAPEQATVRIAFVKGPDGEIVEFFKRV